MCTTNTPFGPVKIRSSIYALTLVVALSVQAQLAPANNPATAADDKDDVVQLSVYRVVSSQDQGYLANTATPFKTRQDMVDIPQAITVVTRDLIDDIGEYDLAKLLTYVGGVPKFGGELFQLRGSNAFSTYPVVDGLISRTVYMDNVFVDSIEIIRGPAALLYPNSQLTGVINKTTRRPQAKSMNSLTTRVTDYGLYRLVGDSTGPIGKVGEGQLNYRLIGGFSRGDAYFTNTKEDRTMFHPTIQWDYDRTSVMLAYDYQEITRPSNPTAVLQPNGKIFTGGGRKNSLFLPPGASETHTHNGVRGNVVHQFSRNWETRLGLDWNEMHRVGSVVLPTGGVNWDARTISFFNRRNDLLLENAAISLDNNGRYELGGMQHQSSFGLNITIQKAKNKLWANDNFGGPGVRFNVRPIDNPSINTLPVLPIGSYIPPANPGNRVRSEFSNFYYQHNVEVIKDHLLLVGGLSQFKDETSNLANYTVNTATMAKVSTSLHRLGVVAQFLDKRLVFYAMTADNQLPPSPTAILEDGTSVPGASGEGKEIGMKVVLLDGKLNATISYFDLETTGLAVFGGVRPDGRTFNILIGKTRAKGFDGEITLGVGKDFELIANFYSGDVKDQNNLPVEDSYTSTIGVVGKYTFRDGGAQGLSIGAGGYHTTGRVTGTGALTYVGKPAQITNDSDPSIKIFANYSLNRNWAFKLELDNVFDGLVPQAINSATLLETNIGRSFTFQATYKF
ncbi:MAG TPA: TonB-dependent receptor [Opitutaceae bacterium]|nr:TonB-dependent receptor [Opitutaceae bacterium]HRJ46925.1 TonB-dependent receptor [Opitutaceae bacterium]